MKPGLHNCNVTKTRIANIFVPNTSCIDLPDFQQQSYRVGAGTSILQEGNLVTCHPHPESAWLGGDLSTRESAAEHWAGLSLVAMKFSSLSLLFLFATSFSSSASSK